MIDAEHKYSYSQLSSYNECPFSYYLGHIETPKPEQAPNAWAEQGTLIHDLLDKWAKGELKKEDLAQEYKRRYGDEVVTAFPRLLASKGYAEKTYQQGLEYFETFDGFPGYEIVAAEKEYDTDIELTDGTKRKFIAYVDLILREKNSNKLVVCDHKSKSLTTFKKERNEMYKQQYIYSYFVHDEYGEWPQTLMFNLFKELGYLDEQVFSMEEFNKTMKWTTESIHQIESRDLLDWLECKHLPKSGKPDMFCQSICSWRTICPQSMIR